MHGGYGAFIPLGIKIGLDAVDRLKAKPRELVVTYYDSEKTPCACFADGVAIALRSLEADRDPVAAGRRVVAQGRRPIVHVDHHDIDVAPFSRSLLDRLADRCSHGEDAGIATRDDGDRDASGCAGQCCGGPVEFLALVRGDFYLATYSETNPYKDAVTFEASLQSTGPVAYTPGP